MEVPAVLAACGFGAVMVAAGILGLISIVSAPTPPPGCTRLGCGALEDAFRLEALIAVIGSTSLLFALALIEGMLGYWLSANLTHWQGYRVQTGR